MVTSYSKQVREEKKVRTVFQLAIIRYTRVKTIIIAIKISGAPPPCPLAMTWKVVVFWAV